MSIFVVRSALPRIVVNQSLITETMTDIQDLPSHAHVMVTYQTYDTEEIK